MLLGVLWLAVLFIEDRDMLLVALIVPCALTGAYVGPTLALVQDFVDPRARAFLAAVLLLMVNLVGAGIGPLAVGVLSDVFLASTAASKSLRYALLAMPGVLAWSAFHYARAMPGITPGSRK